MTDDSPEDDPIDAPNLNRRAVLRNVGTAGAIALVGAGTVVGQGQGENPQEECECPDGMAKYEFQDCEFVHVEGGDWVTIEDWESKEGEECEPISVDYTVDPSLDLVTKVCAFGGTDNVVDDGPDGTFDERLENPGGQRAAISHITFCVDTGFQVDLIFGEPIEELASDNRYNQDPDRLLQALWSTPSGGTELEDDHFNLNDEYGEECGSSVEIVEDIHLIDGEATATLNPGECDCEDFALVSYETAGHEFSFNQEFHDADTSGTTTNGTCVFTVDVP